MHAAGASKFVRVLPNAGAAAGGDTITSLGYGFGSVAGNVSVSVGGQSATVLSVDVLPTFASALGLDSAAFPRATDLNLLCFRFIEDKVGDFFRDRR